MSSITIPVQEVDAPIEICPICAKTFGDRRARNVHSDRQHSFSLALQRINCEFCGKEIETYNRSQTACGGCRGKAISKSKDMGITEDCEWCSAQIDIAPWEYKWKDRFFCDHDCYGKWKSENKIGEKHPCWTGGYKGGYGPNWQAQREKVLSRDAYECQVCGKGQSEISSSLHVHHKRPFRLFDNYEDANKLDNLVTLCEEDHPKVEAGKIQMEVL